MNLQVDDCSTGAEHEQLMHSFFEDLNNFMSSRHGYEKHQCRFWINKIDARCSKFSLTLGFRGDKSVGISAIAFKDERRGHCFALVSFIDEMSNKYRIPYMEFISVQTESMSEFVKKHGFINRDGYFSICEGEQVPSLDWYRRTSFGLQ